MCNRTSNCFHHHSNFFLINTKTRCSICHLKRSRNASSLKNSFQVSRRAQSRRFLIESLDLDCARSEKKIRFKCHVERSRDASSSKALISTTLDLTKKIRFKCHVKRSRDASSSKGSISTVACLER